MQVGYCISRWVRRRRFAVRLRGRSSPFGGRLFVRSRLFLHGRRRGGSRVRRLGAATSFARLQKFQRCRRAGVAEADLVAFQDARVTTRPIGIAWSDVAEELLQNAAIIGVAVLV